MPTDSSNSPAPPPLPGSFPSLDELAADIPPVAWLWPGWIPRGMLTLLCAAPGAGKSYLALDLARRLIAGLPWPDGSPAPEPGANVIYVDAEGAPQLLNARALAWRMDRSHLFPLLAAPDDVLDLNAPRYRDRLLAMAASLQPALVIVDSLGSAGRGFENQVTAVHDLFGFLNRVAGRFQCGLLLIHHLRKRGALARAALAGDDVRGSGHIVSLARSVLGLTAVQLAFDPEPNGPRRLQLLKTNLGPCPAPLGITFVPNGPTGIELSYDRAVEPSRPRTLVESCARWLLDYLAAEGCAQSPIELEWPAHEAGFSRSTLFRARDLLGSRITDTERRHNPLNKWLLAGCQPPAAPPPSPRRRPK